jgi:hypothetical protein
MCDQVILIHIYISRNLPDLQRRIAYGTMQSSGWITNVWEKHTVRLMEEVYSSETLVPSDRTERCHKPENHRMNRNCVEILTSPFAYTYIRYERVNKTDGRTEILTTYRFLTGAGIA